MPIEQKRLEDAARAIAPFVKNQFNARAVAEIAAKTLFPELASDPPTGWVAPMDKRLVVEFRQHDWIEGFAAFAPDATTPNGEAFCVLNLGSLLCAVATGDLPREELPYVIAETMMHEVMHAIEQWAGVEFSEDRIEAMLAQYGEAAREQA